MSKTESNKTGPKPDHVKIDMDWEDAVSDALKKKRPKDGWPKPDSKKKEKKD